MSTRILIRHVVQLIPGISTYPLPAIQGQVLEVVEIGQFDSEKDGTVTLTEQRASGISLTPYHLVCLAPPTQNARLVVVIDGHVESALHA